MVPHIPHVPRVLAAAIGVGALLIFSAPVRAQDGALRGVVVDSAGDPVAGADLILDDGARSTRSGEDGSFAFPGVRPGDRRLRVERLGFAPRTLAVGMPIEAPLRVVLDPQPILMQGLSAIGSPAELAEVRERMRQIPGGVDLIREEELERTRQTTFGDVLRFTPGVYAQSRFGAADETHLSIRGSGLRNNFHLRGVNVLVNGMPYRNADGFTDFESLELLTASNVQVYKGGNALRYGGSTLGGAINIETRTGYTAEPFQVYGQGGSFGFFKAQLSSGAAFDGLDYYASYAHTGLDGFREHSGQRRDRLNAHLGWVATPNVDLRAFWFFAHVEENLPGSLTAEELAADPRAAAETNVADDWGRDYDLHHLGVQIRAQLGPTQRLDVAPYFQYRDIVHPIFRVIDQISRDVGIEARYENTTPIGERDHRFVLGFQPTFGNVDDRQFENEAGESGALAKDQRDEAGGVAIYLEDVLSLTSRVSAVAGLRYDRARRSVEDDFLSDGDQSDERTYEAVQPKLGFLVEIPEIGGQVFGNASRIHEPPLLLELNSLTVPGFIDLEAQDAWQFELGTRGDRGPWRWQLSAYDMEIDDEILNVNVLPFPDAPFTVPTYRNAEETRHLGLEAGLEGAFPVRVFARGDGSEVLDLRLAYTLSRFTFESDPEFAGNDIPGIPTHVVQAEASYSHSSGLSIAPSIEWVPGDVSVNSANTVRGDGWVVLGLRAEWAVDAVGAVAFVEARNLTDEVYSPTFSVDDAVGRYFQPADGRSLYAGIRWRP